MPVLGSIFGDAMANPKIIKSMVELKIRTLPLNMAPAKMSGYQVCADASPDCEAFCLHSAGNPVYFAAKTKSRIAKTRLFFENRNLFLALMVKELQREVKKAAKDAVTLAMRPNMTSDIPYEKYSCTYNGQRMPIIDLIHLLAPAMPIYDYTKNPRRDVSREFYTFTFSLSENNETDAVKQLERGINVAVVFDTKAGHPLPSNYTLGGKVFEVINGDKHDVRYTDIKGVIVGLTAKGKARVVGTDTGFVRAAKQTTFMAA
tara:strand:- start:367 stop:1146 length:780 start_codon:yes stop_codon:yes gene_type:complete